MLKEKRAFQCAELRAARAERRIVGHAAVFNKLSDDLGGFREKIRPGAFSQTITNGDIRSLWNHDSNFILGRTKAGTLSLAEDETGLKIDNQLPDTQFARDLLQSIERGDVDSMSFGFWVPPGGDDWHMEDGGVVRELLKVELFDVSPVTFPAYPQTDVSARSFYDGKVAEVRVKAEQLADMAKDNGESMRDKIRLTRWAARQEFLDRRLPIPDPLELSEILRRARRN